MRRQVRRSVSWTGFGLAALLVLAACTATTTIEPSVGSASGSFSTTTDNDPIALPESDTAVEEEPGDAASVIQEEETATPVEEPAATTVADSQDETVNEETLSDGILDTTNETDVEIFTEDDRSDNLRFLTGGWKTNWSRRTIEYDEILSGGPPRDGIPSIDDPKFVSSEEASDWLADNEPVISLGINGDARAYPLQVLTWHEIANDVVGDVPVVVTFCPLCNSALVFDRRVNGEIVEFGVSGLLRNSDLIMYDRTFETLWQQFTGDAIVGDLVGRRLKFLPSAIVSFTDFRAGHPDGLILSRDTGHNRQYGMNPYAGYDAIGQNPFLFTGLADGRLPAMERVVTVALGDVDVAYPLSILSEAGVINDRQGGQDMVVFHTGGTSSALGAQVIANAEDVGATGVFDPNLNDQRLTFKLDGESIVDQETGSTWSILGQAIDGPLAGEELSPIVHGDHFWFSWAAFKPDTIIFQG